MTRGSDGTWRVTIGPLAPEIYEYSVVVDGTAVLDGRNPFMKPGDFAASLLEVPGTPAKVWERQDVAHGGLELVQYRSTPYNASRSLYVYLPPQYYSEPSRRFPVLYLRHGNGDYEVSWPFQGRAGVILENLIAQGKAIPMIIVMPYGESAATGGGTPEGRSKLDSELLSDVIPFIDGRFRTLSDRDSRAIAGLSMGGSQAAVSAFSHFAQFGWLAIFSSGNPATDPIDRFLLPLIRNAGDINSRLRLLFLSCGTEDPRYPFYLATLKELDGGGIKYQWFSTSGSHEFKVWRNSLEQLLPMLFRPK